MGSNNFWKKITNEIGDFQFDTINCEGNCENEMEVEVDPNIVTDANETINENLLDDLDELRGDNTESENNECVEHDICPIPATPTSHSGVNTKKFYHGITGAPKNPLVNYQKGHRDTE